MSLNQKRKAKKALPHPGKKKGKQEARHLRMEEQYGVQLVNMESGLNQARLGKEIRTLGSIGMDKCAASREKMIRSKMTTVPSK
jgi:hypothetical protein